MFPISLLQYDLEMILDHSQIEIKDEYSFEEVIEAFMEMMERNQGTDGHDEYLVQAAFAYFDRDSSGGIDIEEMARAYEELGTTLTDADRHILQTYNGTLTLADFCEISKGLDLAAEVIRRPPPTPMRASDGGDRVDAAQPPRNRLMRLVSKVLSKRSSGASDSARTPIPALESTDAPPTPKISLRMAAKAILFRASYHPGTSTSSERPASAFRRLFSANARRTSLKEGPAEAPGTPGGVAAVRRWKAALNFAADAGELHAAGLGSTIAAAELAGTDAEPQPESTAQIPASRMQGALRRGAAAAAGMERPSHWPALGNLTVIPSVTEMPPSWGGGGTPFFAV